MASIFDDSRLLHQRAGDWMHRGIDLLNENSASALEQAVGCFDEAIALRRTLPLAENPRHRYALAAGWLNRADALARLGGKDRLAEALQSYDVALGLLRDLPLKEDPLYPRRLAIAWINRGFACQKGAEAMYYDEGTRCFREALAVLEDSASAAIADLALLHAGALVNLAGALLELPVPSGTEARGLAQKALRLMAEEEQDNELAAETGFKARHLLCRAIAMESCDGKSVPPELIAEATGAVDGGLALARHWEQRGGHRFRAVTDDLFRFGCRIYQAQRSHFLTEFILENLDPDKSVGVPPLNPDMHEVALAALWGALKEIQSGGFQSLSTPRFARVLENLRRLRVTEERLEQLRRAGAFTDGP